MNMTPALRHSRSEAQPAPVLVFGGAGFIGSNLAASLLNDGNEVMIFDNLSRLGAQRNLDWLRAAHGRAVIPILADIRDPRAVDEAVKRARAVFHFAAQVAVTSSLEDPRHDFSVNIEGTFNILEALRRRAPATPLIFASTNKVYGALDQVATAEFDGRYLPLDETARDFGFDETRPLAFCTPYGCSKGAADQYVLDYAHSFGLRAAVLRMSCIYGPRQRGTEDQGWVAHFLIRALAGKPITIYGDGKQVRDILHVADAVAAYRRLLAAIDALRGCAFNLGGGPTNAVSLHQVLNEIELMTGREPTLCYDAPRTGDQAYFVADTRRLDHAVGWDATIDWRTGLRDLHDWLRSSGIGQAVPETRRGARATA